LPSVPALSAGYEATRARIVELVATADLAAPVPACPGWRVRDVVAHLAGLAEAVASGERPGPDRQAWLDELRIERRSVPVPDLVERWHAAAPGVAQAIDEGAHGLFVDVVVHEHDIRAALGVPGSRGAPEVRAVVQLQLESLGALLKRGGLGALVIDAGPVTWTSHFARRGCTLRADPWEASRLLASRRTPDEILARVAAGDAGPYVAVLAGRRPLPEESLGEQG
jgi:uncharacterized protein (TIGR03083 family)